MKNESSVEDNFLGVQIIVPIAQESGDICETFESESQQIKEVRVINKEVCEEVLGQRICIYVPVPQRRTCTKTLFAQFCVPTDTEANIKQAIKDCMIAGIAAGVLASIIASPTAFLPVLKTSVKLCLIEKGIEIAFDLKIGLWVTSRCGDWRDV